jgi:hypothetical protein
MVFPFVLRSGVHMRSVAFVDVLYCAGELHFLTFCSCVRKQVPKELLIWFLRFGDVFLQPAIPHFPCGLPCHHSGGWTWFPKAEFQVKFKLTLREICFKQTDTGAGVQVPLVLASWSSFNHNSIYFYSLGCVVALTKEDCHTYGI